MEWQPIETASSQKDVLVWDGENISIAHRSDLFGDWYAVADGKTIWEGHRDRGGLMEVSPTHWMPLPDPPVSN